MFKKSISTIKQFFFLLVGLVIAFFLLHSLSSVIDSTPPTQNKSDIDQIKKTYSKLLINQQIKQDEHSSQNPTFHLEDNSLDH